MSTPGLTRRSVLAAAAMGSFGALTNGSVGTAADFRSSDKLVFTYFFNWYNWPNAVNGVQEHILTYPGAYDYLSVHPSPQTISYDRNKNYRLRKAPNLSGGPLLSYTNPAWFQSELAQMAAVGIDVCAVDFWPFPDPNTPPRSRTSAATLNAALAAMQAVGTSRPAICQFLETTALGTPGGQVTDLHTDAGAMTMFRAIDDFFSRISRQHWAVVDGNAIVIMYAGSVPGLTLSDYGLTQCRKLFREKHGVGLTIIANEGWKRAAPKSVRYTCKWGAAIRSNRIASDCDLVEVAPGYNYRGNDRGTPRDAAKYKAAWGLARESGKKWIAIETWNEWHEATGIANTLEDGDRFLRITRDEIRRFKA